METTWILFLVVTAFTGFVRSQIDSDTKVQVLEGTSEILPCSTPASATGCTWILFDSTGTSDVFEIAPNGQVTISQLPEVTGELIGPHSQGKCDLKLNNIPLKAAGVYTCRIKSSPVYVAKITLEVGTKPSPPRIYYNGREISDGLRHEFQDGMNDIVCKVDPAIPAVELSWTENLQGQQSVEQDGSIINTGKITRDDLLASLTPEKVVTCVAKQRYFLNGGVIHTTATLGLQYPPTQIFAQLADGSLSTDYAPADGVTLFCTANGIPPANFYEWRSQKRGEDEAKEQFVSNEQNYTAKEPALYRCYARSSLSNELKASNVISVNGEKAQVGINGTSETSQDAGVIAGIVVGALLLILIIVGSLIFSYRRRTLCFKERSRDPPAVNQSAAENGTTHLPLNSPEYNEKDGKGDQNENKEKELVYAQLDLTKTQGNNTKHPKPAEEKTEYAQIKFQPKENPV